MSAATRDDVREATVAPSAPRRHGLVSVGYEGREIGEFVADLVRRDVAVLADVRLNAVSRRRGFSKTALGDALRGVGIEYRHLRALGNPRDNRAAFHGADLERGRATFRRALRSGEAISALDDLRELAASTVVAVLCLEADDRRCHRQVVIDEVTRTRLDVDD